MSKTKLFFRGVGISIWKSLEKNAPVIKAIAAVLGMLIVGFGTFAFGLWFTVTYINPKTDFGVTISVFMIIITSIGVASISFPFVTAPMEFVNRMIEVGSKDIKESVEKL